MTFQNIKEIHNLFFGINSFNEFHDYLNTLSENKKLTINKKEDKLCIHLSVEYLFKPHSIDITLSPEKKNLVK